MAKIAFFILLATVICGYIVEASVVKGDDGDDIDESPEGDGGWGKYNDGTCGKGCHKVECKQEQKGLIVVDAKCSNIAQNLEVKNIDAFVGVISGLFKAGCTNEGNCGKCSGLLDLSNVTALLNLFGGNNTNEGAVCCGNSGWGGGDNKFTDCSKKNNACSNDCTSQSSGSGSRGSGCSTNCCTFNCNPHNRLI